MRRRKISSCLSCYRRKVKCDRKKPLCSSCEKNRIPAHLCIYTESPLAPGASNDKKLVDEINSLRQEVCSLKIKETLPNTKETLPNTKETKGYDISDFYVFRKKDERAYFFGPTSIKTFTFFSIYKEAMIYHLSTEILDKYRAWKHQHSIGPTNNRNLESCLDQLPLMLPSYKDISVRLTEYFLSGKSISRCLHETVIFDYFSASFEAETNESDGKVVIKENRNLLKLCAVLSIHLEHSIINQRFAFGPT